MNEPDPLDDAYWKRLDGRRDREERERFHAAMNRLDELSRKLREEDITETERDRQSSHVEEQDRSL